MKMLGAKAFLVVFRIFGPLQRKTALWAIFTFSRKIDLKS